MSNDINKFIIKEKEQLNNIVSGLTKEQKNIVNGDVVFINYLLDLLKTASISKNIHICGISKTSSLISKQGIPITFILNKLLE